MVCYGGGGNITYDAALRLGAVNWGIVEELTQGKPTDWDATQVDMVKAERLINARLVPLMAEMNVDLSQIVHSVDDLKEPQPSKL